MMTYQFGIPNDQTGYYVGYLSTAYYIGQLLCNFPLSLLSDKIGRKPIILMGVGANIICQILFGLSNWYWLAVLTRFINGITNSNVSQTKCYVRDVSNVSTQSRLFSFRSIGFALGSMIAPVVGGLFSRPQDQNWLSSFPFFDNDFYEKYPYSLVCFVVSFIDLICWVILFIFMHETLPKIVQKQQTTNEGDEIEIEMDESSNSIQIEYDDFDATDEHYLLGEEEENEQNMEIEDSGKKSTLSRYLSYVDRGVIIVIILYCLISFYFPVIAQVLPVWITRDISQNGLGFEEKQLGIIYFIGSLVSLLFQLTSFPVIERFIGTSNTFRVGICMFFLFFDYFNLVFNFFCRLVYSNCFFYAFFYIGC